MPESRRHIAVMFTDIVGYTALMGSDEDKAFEVLRKNREIHTKYIEQFNGTLIKEMGDGMLISFDLASEAVRCAIEIQKACKPALHAGTLQTDDTIGIPLKIGIHEGEMVFEDNDVLGDGVNIASRLQDGSEEGCITISGSVYRDIKNKAGIQAEFVGEKQFKNVDEKIKVFKVNCGEGVDDEKSTFIQESRRPGKKLIYFTIVLLLLVTATTIIWRLIPSREIKKADIEQSSINVVKSIAVLPFTDLSPDKDHEHFSEGMTDEILAHLQKIKDLVVKSRPAVEPYRYRTQPLATIGKELNVAFILDGSVRKYGDNIRLFATLIDPNSGNQLWTGSFDGIWSDTIFIVQSNFAKEIALSINAVITPDETRRIDAQPTKEISAYDFLVKGMYEIELHRRTYDKKHLKEAHLLMDRAIEIDPNYAAAYASKAYVFHSERHYDSIPIYANRALEIDPDCAPAYERLGRYYREIGNTEKAFENVLKAYELNPNDYYANFTLGLLYCRDDYNIKKGFPHLKKAFYITGEKVNILNSFGVWLSRVAAYEKAEEFFYRSLAIKAGCENLWLYNRPLLAQGKYKQALAITDSICQVIECPSRCNELFTWIYIYQHDFEKAEHYFMQWREIDGEIILSPLAGYLYDRLGNPSKAQEIFDGYIKKYQTRYDFSEGQTHFRLAQVHAYQNNKKMAIHYLEEMIENKLALYFFDLMKRDPMFESLWSDPDFKKILEQVDQIKALKQVELLEMEQDGFFDF